MHFTILDSRNVTLLFADQILLFNRVKEATEDTDLAFNCEEEEENFTDPLIEVM